MTTLKEEAQAYEPPTTKNVSELHKIPVNLELYEGEGKSKENEVFTYKYIKYEGGEYRIPGSVIGGIKTILKKMPNTEYVTVDKEGIGMNTKYLVLPYVESEVEHV